MIKTLALLPAVAILCGCTTVYSVIEGNFDMPTTELNDYPVRIISVDGGFQTRNDARVEAGMHTLILASRKPSVFHVRDSKAVPFDAAPCTRYYLAARHATRLTGDWTLVVRHTEPVPGCVAAEALAAATPK